MPEKLPNEGEMEQGWQMVQVVTLLFNLQLLTFFFQFKRKSKVQSKRDASKIRKPRKEIYDSHYNNPQVKVLNPFILMQVAESEKESVGEESNRDAVETMSHSRDNDLFENTKFETCPNVVSMQIF